MRVALVGPPQSGKSILFAAVAEAGGSHVDLHRPDRPHVAVVKVPDERLEWLARLHEVGKATYAELEFVDLPGFDLSDPSGRERSRTHWPTLRQSEMLAFVVRAFEDSSVPAYRNRVDPRADLDELLSEMLFADLEQAASRIEKLEAAIRKPTPQREQQRRELELMKRLSDALEAERPVSEAVSSPSEEKMIRSFGFLSQKPALAVLNRGEADLDAAAPPPSGGIPCLGLSAKIEEEIAQLPPQERGEFLSDLGLDRPARDRLIRACYERLNLISFFTVGPEEARATSVPAGTDAVTAAGQIHSDMARGFIRAETIAFDDLRDAGSMREARGAGKIRLEGKAYEVQDGDVIHFRFNV